MIDLLGNFEISSFALRIVFNIVLFRLFTANCVLTEFSAFDGQRFILEMTGMV